METAVIVAGSAITRMAVGAGLIAAPRPLMRVWAGEEAAHSNAVITLQSLGAREVLIGLGTLLTLRDGLTARRWVLVGAGADAADALVTLARLPRLPRVGALLVVGAAVGSVVGHGWLATRMK